MDSAHAPFLAAVLADADSDAPRLQYADFLDETGDPADEARAEFIRLQCALEDLPPTEPRYDELTRRENELLQPHWKEWFAPVAEALDWPAEGKASPTRGPRKGTAFELTFPAGGRGHTVTSPFLIGEPFFCTAVFGRGFVEDLRLDWTPADFVSGVYRVAAITPLSSVTAGGGEVWVRPLIADERFDRIRNLGLYYVTEGALRELVSGGRTDSLRSLELHFAPLPPDPAFDPVPILAGPTRPRGLRRLSLASYPPGRYDLSPLLGSPLLSQCEEFTSKGFVAPDGFLLALADPSRTPWLRRLRIQPCLPVGRRTAERLRERFGDDYLIE